MVGVGSPGELEKYNRVTHQAGPPKPLPSDGRPKPTGRMVSRASYPFLKDPKRLARPNVR